jgi:hypothetical protein
MSSVNFSGEPDSANFEASAPRITLLTASSIVGFPITASLAPRSCLNHGQTWYFSAPFDVDCRIQFAVERDTTSWASPHSICQLQLAIDEPTLVAFL